MIANAWYPIHYFRLSFGKSDSLFDIVMELQRATQIPIDANIDTIIKGLTNRLDDKRIKDELNTLTLNVPDRCNWGQAPFARFSGNLYYKKNVRTLIKKEDLLPL